MSVSLNKNIHSETLKIEVQQINIIIGFTAYNIFFGITLFF